MNNKQIKRAIYFKLIGIEAVVILLMYFVVPIIANYPPYSEEFEFQKAVLGILTHLNQYLLFGFFAAFLFFGAIKYFFKDIFNFLDDKEKNKNDFNQIQKIRSQCYKMPIKLLYFQIAMQILILIAVFITVEIPAGMKIKFTLIYLTFFIAAWTLSVVLVRKELNIILEKTFEAEPKYIMPRKVNYFHQTLMLDLIPFFFSIIIGIILFGYATATDKYGQGIYIYYQQNLKNYNFEKLSKEKIEEQLKTITKYHENDYYFIANKGFQLTELEEQKVSEFFLIYADMYIEKTKGRVYEYFGLQEEGYAIIITLDTGEEVLVGFKYKTSDEQVVIPFVLTATIYTLLYLIIIYVWSKNISRNIEIVAEELNKVAEEKKIENYKVLPIVSTDEIGKLTDSYNKIQQLTIDHIKEIEDSRGKIVEQERLASLGQMIGGIAHNLKTPILSIAGAAEGIKDLSDEMEESLTTSTVTLEDKKEILKEQVEWVNKIKVHLEYMNDIITVVKGQATTFTTEREETFTVKDLFKNVKILTAHEFKNSLTEIEVINNVPDNLVIKGDFNSLLQITNNIIVNAIQSYEGKPNNKVKLAANIGEVSDSLVISIQDFGKGISKEVQNKLFKQMVTTKGKYGTGLGLYMSYSTIKGKFGGDIKFESEEGKGTTFHIIVPVYQKDSKTGTKTKIISENIPMNIDHKEENVEKKKREDVYIKNEENNVKENKKDEKINNKEKDKKQNNKK